MWRLTCAAFFAIASATFVVHERRDSHRLLAKHTLIPLDRETVIPVKIALRQQNLGKGYSHVMNVAHPESDHYGRHWTSEQIQTEFAPSRDALDLVNKWLQQEGIIDARWTPKGGWITFHTSTRKAEELFKTEYFKLGSDDRSTRIGCQEYSLPSQLAPHIDYVIPGVTLSPIRGRAHRSLHKLSVSAARDTPPSPPASPLSDYTDCVTSITPDCLRTLYNLPSPIGHLAQDQLGVFEQMNEYSTADLNAYFAQYAPYVRNGTFPTLVSIDNGTAPAPSNSTVGAESDIDFQTVYGLLGHVNATLYQTKLPYYSVGNFSEYDETFVDSLLAAVDGSYCNAAEIENNFQCGTANLSNVVSVSYSIPELEDYSLAAQQRVCNEFMKLSLKGHTLIFASGDSGVSQAYYGSCNVTGCLTPNGGINGNIFQTTFPSNCPYVLSVGGTQQEPDGSVSALNIPGLAAAQLGCPSTKTVYSSGGGFANYFPQPAYQESAVETYFAKFDPGYTYYQYNSQDVQSGKANLGMNGGVYNRVGRGYPDVSANGRNFASIVRGEHVLSNGTSLATPLWASLIAILNQERLLVGKGPVGFVNPVLYENPTAMLDVTSGDNPGCNSNGYSAVPGWDPITGLGGPNYTALHDIFMGLP